MPERPNIVLICTDQWRGDCLSIDGHPVVHTPYLDELALGGVRFRRAYSASPSCIAARTALMTGLAPRSHGRVGYEDGVEWSYPVTLAGELTRGGYQTQAVGKMHVWPERSQIGFQNVILHDGYLHHARRRLDLPQIDDYIPWLRSELGRSDADYCEHGLNCNSQVARPWDKPEYTHPTNWVTSQAIDFLRRRDPRKPFFLYVSYHRPHPPYDPPAWALEQYLHCDMPPAPVGDWTELFAEHSQPYHPSLAVGPIARPNALHRARAGYYGSITHIDTQIERLMEMLSDYRLHENTIVCFLGDHGELLGDHHLFRKSLPYEGSARVPLILSAPQSMKLPRGETRDCVVELRDVMPTLLELAGLDVPDCVEGRSLLGAVRGEQESVREYVHGEHTWAGMESVQWLTDGREKYVWFSESGTEQLFDLREDPQELCDLAPEKDSEPRRARWRAALTKELAGREEGFSDGERLITGRPVKPSLSFLKQ